MLKRLLLALTVLFFSLSMASAKDADRASLLNTVETFEAAMGEGDFDTVMSLVPEKVFRQMADELEVTPERLSSLVVKQMKVVLADVKILEFDMQTSGFEIEETTHGVAYVFLPTRTVVDVQGAKVEAKSHTLALRDGKEWRLVRVEDTAQLKVLRDVYPGFTDVEFPPGSVKLLN